MATDMGSAASDRSAIKTIVIVGGGLAGARTAEALRKEGFEGRIVLVGEEADAPYDRPPLTKDYLRGETDRAGIDVHPAAFYDEKAIELRLGTRATRIDVATRRVELDGGGNSGEGGEGGEALPFDRLLLATGSDPRHPGIPGAELPGVHYLRRVGDADALRAALQPGRLVVVVGGGWIGTEVAASARTRGCDVTIVATGPLLAAPLGPEAAAVFSDAHLDHGVKLVLKTGVAAIRGDGRAERVVTTDGREIPCEVVVAGVGATPRLELALNAGLAIDGGGVAVNELLESSEPGIFAAGDMAAAWHPLFERRIRLEHWAGAKYMGPAVAKSMLGMGRPFDRLPYFYSDQYDLSMEYRGFAPRWDRVVLRGTVSDRSFLAFWVADDLVVAAMNVNVDGQGKAMEAIIRARRPVDERRLADPTVPLEELAGG